MKLKKFPLVLSTATTVTISGTAVADTEDMKPVTTNHNAKGDKGSPNDIAPEGPEGEPGSRPGHRRRHGRAVQVHRQHHRHHRQRRDRHHHPVHYPPASLASFSLKRSLLLDRLPRGVPP